MNDFTHCPACDSPLEGEVEAVGVARDGEDSIRTSFDCPECSEPLLLTIESAMPDALGFDITLERESDE